MRQDAFISNMDDLQRWFELNQGGKEPRPYFTLWRGYEQKTDRIILRNTEVGEPDEAWKLLDEVIEAHSAGGGSFRIFLTEKPAHNSGMSTLLKLPNPNPTGQPAGIQGLSGPDLDKRVDDEVNRRIEIYELKRAIQDLKEEKQASVTGLDQVRDLLGEFPELRQLGFLLGQKLMGLQGAPAPIPAAVAGEGNTHANAEGYDYDVIEPAIDRLKNAVGVDAEIILPRLANWATQNPEMARQMLQNLPTT